MKSYNIVLYEKRMSLKMNRRQFAKELGIPFPFYIMIESGYRKPFKKECEKISKYLELDFNQYLVGEASYPTDIPDKKKKKIIQWWYHLITLKSVKIVAGVFAFFLIALIPTSFIINNHIDTHTRDFFSAEYLQFHDALVDKGETSISIVDTFTRPEIYSVTENTDFVKYVSIKGYYEEKKTGGKTLAINFWENATQGENKYEYRSTTGLSSYRDNKYYLYNEIAFSTDYSPYEDLSGYQDLEKSMEGFIVVNSMFALDAIDNTAEIMRFEFNGLSEKKIKSLTNDKPGIIMELKRQTEDLVKEKAIIPFFNDMDDLISEKLNLNIDTKEVIVKGTLNAANTINTALFVSLGMLILGIVLGGALVFFEIYAFAYGVKFGEEEKRQFKIRGNLITLNSRKEMKTDIKIGPFLPETFLEILGILIIMVASLRILTYVEYIFGANGLTFSETQDAFSVLNNLFFYGMFLLYFIDFDIFLEDKRVIRNIFLYLFIFIGIYGLEVKILDMIVESRSLVLMQITKVKFPNMFFSISCYFAIMFFLFYTPKFIKNKKSLVAFRLISLIPTILIFVWYFIFWCANDYWGWNLPNEILYLFDSEKIGFSILCVLYLYSYFFLRLFFEKKYGTERAHKFFNGNRFLWIKNLLTVFIIFLVWLMSYLLRDNDTAVSLGLTSASGVYTLIPILLFYHPHKGERNKVIDYSTLFLYVMALAFGYILAARLVLFSSEFNSAFNIFFSF